MKVKAVMNKFTAASTTCASQQLPLDLPLPASSRSIVTIPGWLLRNLFRCRERPMAGGTHHHFLFTIWLVVSRILYSVEHTWPLSIVDVYRQLSEFLTLASMRDTSWSSFGTASCRIASLGCTNCCMTRRKLADVDKPVDTALA